MEQPQDLMFVEFEIYLRQPKRNEEISLNTEIETIVCWHDCIPNHLKVFKPIIANELKKSAASIHDVAYQYLLNIDYYRRGDYVEEEGDKPIITVTAFFDYPIQTGDKIVFDTEAPYDYKTFKGVVIDKTGEHSHAWKKFQANLHQAVSNVYKNVAKICYERKLP